MTLVSDPIQTTGRIMTPARRFDDLIRDAEREWPSLQRAQRDSDAELLFGERRDEANAPPRLGRVWRSTC
ncbi:MAG: hypothetical protein AAGG01_06220 [Planctomycetota bacterium]